jgi:hypothetical protein
MMKKYFASLSLGSALVGSLAYLFYIRKQYVKVLKVNKAFYQAKFEMMESNHQKDMDSLFGIVQSMLVPIKKISKNPLVAVSQHVMVQDFSGNFSVPFVIIHQDLLHRLGIKLSEEQIQALDPKDFPVRVPTPEEIEAALKNPPKA